MRWIKSRSACVRSQSRLPAFTQEVKWSEVSVEAIDSHTSSLVFSTPAAMQKRDSKQAIVRGELQSMLQSKARGGPWPLFEYPLVFLQL